MMYPVLALSTIDGVGTNSLEADATWVFSRLVQLPRSASKTNHYLCLAQVDPFLLSLVSKEKISWSAPLQNLLLVPGHLRTVVPMGIPSGT